jgi:hypothetical protein
MEVHSGAGSKVMKWTWKCLLVMLMLSVQAGSAHAFGGGSGCEASIHAPEDWVGLRIMWGPVCEDGVAQGVGVLKGLRVTKPVKVFYGLVDQGQLKEGVVEADGKVVAGQFEHGVMVPARDKKSLSRAFDAASQAAQAMSVFYHEKNNQKLADEFAQKAKKFQENIHQ